MKQLIVLILIAFLAKYGWDQYQANTAANDPNPETITHPVYAEVRINMTTGARSVDGVLFAITVNQADCQEYARDAQASVSRMVGSSTKGGPKAKVTSSECTSALTARNARLFENQPTHVNYLALARGDRREREERVIYWGITAAEGELVCSLAASMQQGRKGAVTCIRARGS